MLGFAQYVMPPRRDASGTMFDAGYEAHWHHRLICAHLDRVVSGEITRLMVLCPPRHGKSQLVSRLLPAYALGRDPSLQIISASYGADLAQSMSRDAQRVLDSEEYRRLFPRVALNGRNVRSLSGSPLRNVDEWEVVDPDTGRAHKGRYKCAGVGGPLTGRGFDLGLIDDPVKDAQEADSAVTRERVWEWYTQVFYTRRQGPRAAIVLLMTCWHEDDLAGRLQRAMRDGSGDQWHILRLPALAEAGPSNAASGANAAGAGAAAASGDPRQPGEALWPARMPQAELEKIRRLTPRAFSALYQQRPTPHEGAVWRRAYLRSFRFSGHARHALSGLQVWPDGDAAQAVEVADLYRFATVDLALGKRDSDLTAIAVWGIHRDTGLLYLLELDCGLYGASETLERLARHCDVWRLAEVYVESVQYQAALVELGREQGGLPLRELVPDRDKKARLLAAEPMGHQRRILFDSDASATAELEHELLAFRGRGSGEADDRVDVVAYGAVIAQDETDERTPDMYLALRTTRGGRFGARLRRMTMGRG